MTRREHGNCVGCEYYDCVTTHGDVEEGAKYEEYPRFPVRVHRCFALPDMVIRGSERAIDGDVEGSTFFKAGVWRVTPTAPKPPRRCALYRANLTTPTREETT